MFAREDWTLFRNLSTLGQKAGVPVTRLRALVLKELMDNALDACPGGKPDYGEKDGWLFIEDAGPGIPGDPQEVATIFSIRRPLTSTKILRRPSRGALGNGTRVIAGTILASGGQLRVQTRGKILDLKINDDGTTDVARWAAAPNDKTRVSLKFGAGLPRKPGTDDWSLARLAHGFAYATTYQGKSSAWWYDSDSWYELMQAAGATPLDQLLPQFDGMQGGPLRTLILDYGKGAAGDLSRDDADTLLGAMRGMAREVNPNKIGKMVEGNESNAARRTGVIDVRPGRGRHSARLPFTVEVVMWESKNGDDEVTALINGTSITGDMDIQRREKSTIAIFGCGLAHRFPRFPKVPTHVLLNVTSPYIPITTDGKEPDLARYADEIHAAIKRAGRSLRANMKRRSGTKVDILEANLQKGVAKASGDGEYRFSLRQLYYAMRPYVLDAAGSDGALDYNHFTRWVSQYENTNGEIAGMYRDARGTLYTPHTHETISIGTIAVEQYERPKFTFNKVLYIEKEGLFEVLKQVHFPERFDCALLSSKGFASRAVRDLIDLLGESDEPVHVYAIHDADGPGTLIYEALVSETVARSARTVKVHNLGLEPWEGRAMGLQEETFVDKRSKVPVARYIRERDRDEGEDNEEWLQTHRIELNSMTSPQFIEWLEEKFEALGVPKVIPSDAVMQDKLTEHLTARTREHVTAEILKANGFEERAKATIQVHAATLSKVDLRASVSAALDEQPALLWSAPIEQLAGAVVTTGIGALSFVTTAGKPKAPAKSKTPAPRKPARRRG